MMSCVSRGTIAIVVLSLLAAGTNARADFLYWSAPGGIYGIAADGSGGVQTVVSGASAAGVAVDTPSGHLYWVGSNASNNTVVWRSGLDGSGQIVVLDTGGRFGSRGLDLDLVNRDLYFSAANGIIRDDLDPATPASLEFLPQGGTSSLDVAVDATGRQAYWTSNTWNAIRAVDLDTGLVTEPVDNISGQFALDLDLVNDQVYWTDPANDRVRRANLDGTSIETIATGETGWDQRGIALDVAGNRVFWLEDHLTDGSRIWNRSLTGGTPQLVTTFTQRGSYLAFSPSPAAVPEPSSLVLLGLVGGAGLVGSLRRRRNLAG